MAFSIGGVSTGDFKETSGRVQIFHVVTRNSLGLLTPDAFTQASPGKVTDAKSTTLTSITKTGVLGGSFAFTRPDYANGYIGGPYLTSYTAGCQPVGVFLNDALGNPFENTPGSASGRGPYLCGSGTTIGLSVYETKGQITQGSVTKNAAMTWATGDKVYASINGFATNLSTDAYEYNVSGNPAPAVMGIVKVAPDANSALLVLDLRV
jgi:hypothetical protein